MTNPVKSILTSTCRRAGRSSSAASLTDEAPSLRIRFATALTLTPESPHAARDLGGGDHRRDRPVQTTMGRSALWLGPRQHLSHAGAILEGVKHRLGARWFSFP